MESHIRSLAPGNSLEVRLGSRMVFSSTGRWLHPLLELEAALDREPDLDRERLSVVDKIVGSRNGNKAIDANSSEALPSGDDD